MENGTVVVNSVNAEARIVIFYLKKGFSDGNRLNIDISEDGVMIYIFIGLIILLF